MALVYEHRRLTDDQVFYVGITKNDKYRPNKVSGRNTWWNNIVNKHGRTVNVLFDNVDYKQAKQIEKYLIGYYGRRDLGTGSLVNLTDGGEGDVGQVVSEATKEKLRQHNLGKTAWNKGIPQSEEVKKKISKTLKGRPSCNLGRKLSPKDLARVTKQNRNRPIEQRTNKSIEQWSLDDNYIATFISIREAERVTGASSKHISSVAKGNSNRKQTGGFKWRYPITNQLSKIS